MAERVRRHAEVYSRPRLDLRGVSTVIVSQPLSLR
jgi:hypothetical protein